MSCQTINKMDEIIDFFNNLTKRDLDGKNFQDLKCLIVDEVLVLGLNESMYMHNENRSLGIEPTSSNDSIEVSGDFGGVLLPYEDGRNTLHRLILAIELVSGIKLKNKKKYKDILVIC